MKKIILFIFTLLLVIPAFAQSESVGQAGGMQLLMNSWGRSSGFMGLNVANVDGIEGNGINPAGMATTKATELIFSNTNWLRGSDITVSSFGLSQSVNGGSSVLGLAVNTVSVGEIERTTTDLPDGTLGKYKPSIINISANYAKVFIDKIHIGVVFRLISESTPEVSATGLAFDMGVQYRTGEDDRMKLGIALRNVGPTMKYSGDGLTARVLLNPRNSFDSRTVIPAAEYELPVVLKMGLSYDIKINESNMITVLGAYNSHSFYNNQGGLGAQYNYKDYFMLRAAYLYESDAFDPNSIQTDGHAGLAVGATLQAPMDTGRKNAEGGIAYSRFGLDLSYRTTESAFGGTLTIGARIDL